MEKGFLCNGNRDDDVTVPEHTSDSPSCRNPIGIGKSTAYDAHDGDDDELQRFSKGVAAPYLEMIEAVMGREFGSASATKCDADPEPRVPSSSRTSPAARRVCYPARLSEACILGAPPLEAAMPLRDASFLVSAASG